MARPQNLFPLYFLQLGKIAIVLALLIVLAEIPTQAQTLTTIAAFSGSNGAAPDAGLVADAAGNLYGTTQLGGNTGCQSQLGCGTVFKLSPSGTGWTLTTIYKFHGAADGWWPISTLLLGSDGSLYGTTWYGGVVNAGGHGSGYGTVFKMTPPTEACGDSCSWTHTVIYAFTGGSDGGIPNPGNLTFDGAGNIYGTTEGGGVHHSMCLFGYMGCGVVYKLTPSATGWIESVVYTFTGAEDGSDPLSGVTFDQNGNIYGTASEGGSGGYGTVFELSPSAAGWKETTLHSFDGHDGVYPVGGLIFDESGNLYGTTSGSVTQGGGTFFEFPVSNGFQFTLLYTFQAQTAPTANLILSNGNFYGTSNNGGTIGWGDVFVLMQKSSNWSAVSLYNFTAGNDGASPYGNVVLGANGAIYGTTNGSGLYSDGTVYELTP